MKTLNITISEKEFDRFGFPSEDISFEEFIELVRKEIVKEALEQTRSLAEEAGISEMNMADIDTEIRAVRDAEANN
jgi:hypothetical protein